jgi:hypothetical protein
MNTCRCIAAVTIGILVGSHYLARLDRFTRFRAARICGGNL